jgi:hypothetical protein
MERLIAGKEGGKWNNAFTAKLLHNWDGKNNISECHHSPEQDFLPRPWEKMTAKQLPSVEQAMTALKN